MDARLEFWPGTVLQVPVSSIYHHDFICKFVALLATPVSSKITPAIDSKQSMAALAPI